MWIKGKRILVFSGTSSIEKPKFIDGAIIKYFRLGTCDFRNVSVVVVVVVM